jgi:hypothetical protein
MLSSPRAVIAAVGGVPTVAQITRRTVQVVINWKRFKTFPASTYLELTEALADIGQVAPPRLWNQRHYRKPKNGKRAPN